MDTRHRQPVVEFQLSVRALDIIRVYGVVDTGQWESTVRGKQSQAGGEQRVRGVKRQIVTVE